MYVCVCICVGVCVCVCVCVLAHVHVCACATHPWERHDEHAGDVDGDHVVAQVARQVKVHCDAREARCNNTITTIYLFVTKD